MIETERHAHWAYKAGQKAPIGQAEAIDLLTKTSTNNQTGLIGGPWTTGGYTLAGSVRIVRQCVRLETGTYRGVPALCAHLDGHGAHVWYLNPHPRRENPWD